MKRIFFAPFLLTVLITGPQNLSAAAPGSGAGSLSNAANIAGEKLSVPLDERLAALDQMAAFTKEYQSHFEQLNFDLKKNLDALNYEASTIIEFVKSGIGFEQYPGVLRGPLGTLLSRSGNSIDQSLLLAKLLRDAGYDARIVGGGLSVEQARKLLVEMKRARSDSPPQADVEGLISVLNKYSTRGSLNEEQKAVIAKIMAPSGVKDYPPEYALVQQTTKSVIEWLESSDVELDSAASSAILVEEARQYHWVQFREQSSEPWTDIHPAFSGDLQIEQPEAKSFINEEVPTPLQHRFKFQVFLERKVGDKLEVVPLGAPWERPVANLIGVPLTFLNIPDSMLNTNSASSPLEKSISDSTTFMPMFGTEIISGGQYFDLHGNLIDTMVAQDPAAGVFRKVGSSFRDAAGSIGGEEKLPTLTAQWMEFTFIDPTGQEQTFRRTTFDRIGPANREAGTVPDNLAPTTPEDALSLLQRHSFALHVGDIPKAYALKRGADYFAKTLPIIKLETQRLAGMEVKDEPTPQFTSEWSGHLTLQSLFDLSDTFSDAHRVYRPGPALVIHRSGIEDKGKAIESVDIVTNPVRAVFVDKDQVSIEPEFGIKAGVWETAIEGKFLQGEQTPQNTWSAFEFAKKNGIDIKVISKRIEAGTLDLSPDTIAALNNDLDRGYVVVVPSRETAPASLGWWRIHPETGETLGQFGDGRGVNITQYLTLKNVAKAVTYGCLTVGLANCTRTAATYGSFLCCSTINVGLFAMGFLYIKLAVVSILYDGVTLVGPFSSVCSYLE